MESVASATHAPPPQAMDHKELYGIKGMSNHSEDSVGQKVHGMMQSFEEKVHGSDGEGNDAVSRGVSPSPDCSLSTRQGSSNESRGVASSSFSKVCEGVDPTVICEGGSDAVNPFGSKVSTENDGGAAELRCAYVSTTSSPAGGSAFGGASGPGGEAQEDTGADNGGLLSESFFDPAAATSPSAASDAQHNAHIGGYQLHAYGASPTSSSPVADASFAYGADNGCAVFGYPGSVNVFGPNAQLPAPSALPPPQTNSASPLPRGVGCRYIGDTSVNLAAQMVEAEQALRASRSATPGDGASLHGMEGLGRNPSRPANSDSFPGVEEAPNLETSEGAREAGGVAGAEQGQAALSAAVCGSEAKTKAEEEGVDSGAPSTLRGVRAAAKSSVRGCGASALRNKKEKRCWGGGRLAARLDVEPLSASGSCDSGVGGPRPPCAFQRSSLSVRLGELVKRAMQDRHKLVWLDRSDVRGFLPLPGIQEEGVYCVWTDRGLDVLVEVHHVVPSSLCPVGASNRERMTLRPFLVLGSTSFAQLFEGVCRRTGTLVHCKPKVVNTRVYSAGKKNKAALSVGVPAAEEDSRAAEASTSRPCSPDVLPANDGRRRVYLGPAPSPVDWQLHYLTKKGRVVGEDYVFYRQRTCDDQGAPVYNILVSARKLPKAVAKHHFHFDDPRPRSSPSSREEKEPSESAENSEGAEDSAEQKESAPSEPSLLPLEAEAAALQHLKKEKEKFLSEHEARSGWRGWEYAEDNCDFDGFDSALGLPASLAMEVRVLLGLQPSIMAHRCNVSLANHRIVSSLQRRCRFFVLSPEGDERIAEVQPFGDGKRGADEAWAVYRAQQLRLSNSASTASERRSLQSESCSRRSRVQGEGTWASEEDGGTNKEQELSARLRRGGGEDSAGANGVSPLEDGVLESPSNASSRSRSRSRRSLSTEEVASALGTRRGRRASKARLAMDASLTASEAPEEETESPEQGNEDADARQGRGARGGEEGDPSDSTEERLPQATQTASAENPKVKEENSTMDSVAEEPALDVVSLDELKAESMRTPDANSLVSSLRLPEGVRVEVEFPTEFHSFMETDRVRIVSKEQLIAALAKLKAYAEHYSKELRRQSDVDAFFEFMAAEFEKRSIRLKEKKAELDKLETETRKSRLPAAGDSDETALVTAFIDVESGVLKRPFSLVSTAQRRVLYMYCLRNNLHANIRICKIAGKGRAVIAADTIRKDDFVLEYKGELCSEREARERDMRYDRSRSLKGSFMFYFKHKDRQMSIDATEERREFGPARLINHSRKNPNLRPKAEALDGQAGDLRLFFIALRDIQEGEELLVDYGERDPEALKQNPWLNE